MSPTFSNVTPPSIRSFGERAEASRCRDIESDDSRRSGMLSETATKEGAQDVRQEDGEEGTDVLLWPKFCTCASREDD